jgi:hypothetical protein
MKWSKRGLLIAPEQGPSWARSHAMLPVADPLNSRLRLYFATRDDAGRSHIARTELDFPPEELPAPAGVEPHPVLAPGPLGAFDDNGVTCSALVTHDGRRHLYYTGWTVGQTVPFYVFVGCAVSTDGSGFEKVSPAPILERNPVDPYLTGHPSVLVEAGRWRMWYASGTGWSTVDGRPRHHYHIKYAESDDGIQWRRDGHVCIDYANAAEYALGRPYVIRDGGLYRMWYSRRGDSYRIGYAESSDGLSWRRKDAEAGIDVSPSGWDSEMVAYACVFDTAGERWMLYNGNGYGRTGIGLAQLSDR